MASSPSSTPPRIQPETLRRGGPIRLMTRDGRAVDFGAYWRRGGAGHGLIVGLIAGEDRPTVWRGDGYLVDESAPSASDLFDSPSIVVWGRWRRSPVPGQPPVLEIVAIPEGGAASWPANPPTSWVSADAASAVVIGQFSRADWLGAE